MTTLLIIFALIYIASAEYILSPLPFKEDALEPFISKQTISIHYNKHHGGYVKKLNKAADSDPNLRGKTVDEIVHNAPAFPVSIVNLASQIANHEFYWKCITPMDNTKSDSKLPNELSNELLQAMTREWTGYDKFKIEFTNRAKKHFGSGWLWLIVQREGNLEIADGHDAENPLSHGEFPLLTIDIWEHAYYLDYKNERGRYVDAFFERINWKFVSEQYQNARGFFKQEL
eukprot:391483_1